MTLEGNAGALPVCDIAPGTESRVLPHAVAHLSQNIRLSSLGNFGAASSLMVLSVPSVGLRYSWESEDGSGVVPVEESIPMWETDDTDGEATMDDEDARCLLEAAGLSLLVCFVEAVADLLTVGNI